MLPATPGKLGVPWRVAQRGENGFGQALSAKALAHGIHSVLVTRFLWRVLRREVRAFRSMPTG